MKTTIISILLLLFTICIFSCGDNAGTSAASDSAVVVQRTMEKDTAAASIAGCYRLVSGLTQRDTSMVRLQIEGSSVTGDFITSIYEKDRRKGTFKGTIAGGIINAVWIFSQEGGKDSLPLVFRVNGPVLEQKKFSYHPQTGREYITDSAGFTTGFEKIPCPE